MPLSSYPNLSRLLDQDEAWTLLGDFDRLMLGAEERIRSITAGSDATEAARRMHAFARNHHHLFLVGQYKIREIARGIGRSLESDNTTVLFSLARALVEHTAAIAFQTRSLSAAVSDLPKHVALEKFTAAIEKHGQRTAKLYYNEKARVHVNDMIDALANYLPEIQSGYDQLCEFVHPNYGSNQLVSSGTLGSGIIGSNAAQLGPELLRVHDLIEQCAMLVDDALTKEVTSYLGQVGSWVEIASRDGAKLSQIFSTRRAVSGDGHTKETALFFNKARTHTEAIQAFYAYLSAEALVMLSRQNAGIEEGFLYDKIETSQGTRWVKYLFR